MEIVDEHDKLLVEEGCVFSFREDRLGHCCGHHGATVSRLGLLFLKSGLSDVVVDAYQILQF